MVFFTMLTLFFHNQISQNLRKNFKITHPKYHLFIPIAIKAGQWDNVKLSEHSYNIKTCLYTEKKIEIIIGKLYNTTAFPSAKELEIKSNV